ncbi:MAG: histidine kinase [Gemmatimonadota bacterium]|nr:MAG: histidine kinase [Gemmatimonadota bacterium]
MPKRLTFWIIQLAVWGAYGLSTYLSGLPSLSQAEMVGMLGAKMVRAALGLGISLGLYVLYRRLMRRPLEIRTIAGVAVLASVVASGIWQILYLVVESPPWSESGFVFDWGSYRMAFPDYAFVMLAWSAAYLGIEFWRYSKVQEQNAAEAKALAHEAQLETLSYQLNPHFLFNALNSIRALIQEDRERARDVVTQLSEFLRYTLVKAPLDMVPLREEVDVLSRYLQIEKTRFEDKLVAQIEIDPAAGDSLVPAFILHPLVENAVKHGMRTSRERLQVSIRARDKDGCLEIEVANTGTLGSDSAGAGLSDGAGIGLRNVEERLVRLYPGRHKFSVIQQGDWVRAIVRIGRLGAEIR